jgi:hypothetical protein
MKNQSEQGLGRAVHDAAETDGAEPDGSRRRAAVATGGTGSSRRQRRTVAQIDEPRRILDGGGLPAADLGRRDTILSTAAATNRGPNQ